MESSSLMERLGRALALPHPHVQEENRAFTVLENWRQIAAQIASQSITVKPLGYYRSPDSVDVYVIECSMGGKDGNSKCWKIYRRYRHFQQYVTHASEVLSSMVVPRLSQAYMKIFHAKHCKDRMVELHAWLEGVIENTQTYCSQKGLTQDEFLQRLENYGGSNNASNSSTEIMPAIMLSCFLLCGANTPFPHYFRGMPAFAMALEEMNIQLTTKAPVFASKLRSSLGTNSGLGLRLTPTYEQQGKYFGATISGFLRDSSELDVNLARVNVGSKLVRINGVDVADEPFDKVLLHLRSVGMPLRLRFLYDPQLSSRHHSKSLYLKDGDAVVTGTGNATKIQDATERSQRSSVGASMDDTFQGSPAISSRSASKGVSASLVAMDGATAAQRSYSVDSRKSVSIFSSVFGDIFGRKRNDTADMLLSSNNQVENIFSWDDIGGEYSDQISRGFFSFLPQSILHELRQKRMPYVGKTKNDMVADAEDDAKTWKTLDKRKGQGIWSTCTGPLGLCFGACKIQDVQAAMLEIAPAFFSSRLGHMGSGKRLTKGFVLISVNNESTFGKSFASVMKLLTNASRPTSICFRWFKDFSPFLETELTEQDADPALSSRRGAKQDPARTFESSLDCVAEAHIDLSSNLHLALVENASIRNEITALHESHREQRLKYEQAEKVQRDLREQVQARDAEIARLQEALAGKNKTLETTRIKLKAAEGKLVGAKQEYQQLVEAARASAIQRITEHEERLVQESNKSIANAKLLADRKSQKQLEDTINAMQREHDEYLQKLAEEHSEEVESLMQQVAVWRHQVEVLTEAEKRNYASFSGAPRDYHRGRYAHADSPFSSSSANGSARTIGGPSGFNGHGHGVDKPQQPHVPYRKDEDPEAIWHDGESPESSSEAQSDRSSLSNGPSGATQATFWDRVVSLI